MSIGLRGTGGAGVRISPDELRAFQHFVQERCGICLGEGKAYLFEARLAGLLQELRCGSFSDLYRQVCSDTAGRLTQRVIDAMTTNETLFFRDATPFEVLRFKVLPELADKRCAIRVWSAGCSAGQEAYSIAMVAKEVLGCLRPERFSVLGTDVSTWAVERARAGVYSRFEVERGLSEERRQQHLVAEGDCWRVREDVRSVVSFDVRNLMRPFEAAAYDVVFCRNVAIYFALEERVRLFARIADALKPEGVLFVGGSESVPGVEDRLAPTHDQGVRYYRLQSDGADPRCRPDVRSPGPAGEGDEGR